MSSLFDLLAKIHQKPGLYIGIPSVSVLRHFLVGYKFARQEMGVFPTEAELDFYHEFQPWLQTRLQVQTVQSWDQIILIKSADEKAAFEAFFHLLDEFQNRSSIHEASTKGSNSPIEPTEKVA